MSPRFVPGDVQGPGLDAAVASGTALRDLLAADPATVARSARQAGAAVPHGTRIALIGTQLLIADALSYLLAATTEFEVLGAFSSADEMTLELQGDAPQLVLVDVDMPSDAGQATLAALRVGEPLKVVVLAEALTTSVLNAAIEHRADGVLLKSESLADLLAGLRHIVSGHTILPAGWHDVASRPPDEKAHLASLSPRQVEVLELLAAGRRNEEIAAELFVSPNTVKFHVRAILARLGVRNRVEAAQFLAKVQRDEGR